MPYQSTQLRRNPGLRQLLSFRPQQHPRTTAIFFLWLAGIFFMFVAPAPRKVTPEMQQAFDVAVKKAYASSPQRAAAQQTYFEAHLNTQDSKVWFWRFRPEHRSRVKALQKLEKQAANAVKDYNRQQEKQISDAKASLGLWSDAGLDESRQLFWQSFDAGKVFARRQTFWDTMVNVLTARDRNVITIVIELLCTTVINFTFGMLISIFAFLASLPSLLISYQPTWWSGLGFFVVSMIGACSVIVAFLVALWGSGTAAVYSIVYLADSRGRLQGSQGSHRPQRIHFD